MFEVSGPGDVMADGCRPPAGGKCLLETSEEAEPEDRTSPGASAVECVCVRYWRGAEREEQFMVCQRMSEKIGV